MRLFIAIPLEETLQSQLEELTQELDSFPLRFVPKGNFHLTLRFLGDCDASTYKRLLPGLERISLRHSPFSLRLQRLGFFGPSHHPRVIWVGLLPSSPLESLVKDVERWVQSIGFAPEDRPFRGHITLARSKKNARHLQKVVEKIEKISFSYTLEVERFSLFESHLRPQGAVYEEKATFCLRR